MSNLAQSLLIPDSASTADATPSPFASPICAFRVQCHYCGYEPATLATSKNRCPKCGGSAWERYVVRGRVLEAVAGQVRSDVTFALSCRAVRAYVSCNFEDGSSSLTPMTQTGQDSWRATLRLVPGIYRYRFYVDDGRLLIYWAAEGAVTDANGNGLDGIFVVAKPRRRGPRLTCHPRRPRLAARRRARGRRHGMRTRRARV